MTERFVRLQDAIKAQDPTPTGWVCPDCYHYGTGVHCGNGYFISVVGANMEGCPGYIEKLHKDERRREWRETVKKFMDSFKP